MPKTYKKRRNNKKAFRRPQTSNFYRTIQTADKHPSTALVKYSYQDVFKVQASGPLNLASILAIPVSDLNAPIARQGSWTPNNSTYSVDGLEVFRNRYYHMVVLGAKVTISASSLANGAQGDLQKNIMFITQTPDLAASMPSNVQIHQLQKNMKSHGSMYFNMGSTKNAYLKLGYSPRKTWNIPKKDAITSRNDLKLSNQAGASPNDRTFIQVALANPIQGDAPHEDTFVNVKVEYLVRHYEAIITNNESVQSNKM